MQPKITVLYHFLYPDDVVSARQYGWLCRGLAQRGWSVEAHPCNRAYQNVPRKFESRTHWEGVDIRRVWRPPTRQSSFLGRIFNSIWMITAWSLRCARRRGRDTEVFLVGTDPVMAALVASWIRRFRPRSRLVHWCFDLYPEALFAGGMAGESGLFGRASRRLLRSAYQACDLIADIGPCMRDRLRCYGSSARQATLTPWALWEPTDVPEPDMEARRRLFGTKTLGLLYSGTFGRAHDCTMFLELAAELGKEDIGFAFAVRGNRSDELHQAIKSMPANVVESGFVPEADLDRQLAAADIHMVSVRAAWSGVVVPSKFFAALAAGRPVLFSGPRNSSIARWILDLGVGWVVDEDSLAAVTKEIRDLAANRDRLRQLQIRCHTVYHRHFNRERVIAAWDKHLRSLLLS